MSDSGRANPYYHDGSVIEYRTYMEEGRAIYCEGRRVR